MPFSKGNRTHTINGIIFIALFSMAAYQLSDALHTYLSIALSPLIAGILIGMFYGNTLGHKLPTEWKPGIAFSGKKILRLAIIFYGFRITFQQIDAVGQEGISVAFIMLTGTMILGAIVGTRLLSMDRDTTILTSSGSAVCGAAAVLATEGALKAEAYKAGVAIATVVIFGTITLFVYPYLYSSGLLDLSPTQFGVYIGSTVHEVAQVVAIGGAYESEVAETAVIVKMSRVLMIAPMLIVIAILFCFHQKRNGESCGGGRAIAIPWFAVAFVGVAGFNSMNILEREYVDIINALDTFFLTMAMTAIGVSTDLKKVKEVGSKPFILATILFAWLSIGGYFITKAIVQA